MIIKNTRARRRRAGFCRLATCSPHLLHSNPQEALPPPIRCDVKGKLAAERWWSFVTELADDIMYWSERYWLLRMASQMKHQCIITVRMKTYTLHFRHAWPDQRWSPLAPWSSHCCLQWLIPLESTESRSGRWAAKCKTMNSITRQYGRWWQDWLGCKISRNVV